MNNYDAGADFVDIKNLTIEDAIKEFEKNNEIIANEFELYPNAKLCFLMDRNLILLHTIASAAILPYKVKN